MKNYLKFWSQKNSRVNEQPWHKTRQICYTYYYISLYMNVSYQIGRFVPIKLAWPHHFIFIEVPVPSQESGLSCAYWILELFRKVGIFLFHFYDNITYPSVLIHNPYFALTKIE
jgi:hypothetical protein